MNDTTSLKEIDEYVAKYGKRGATTLSILGKMVGFVEAMKSPIGQELLKDDITRMEELLDKMIAETIEQKELAELRYLKNDRLPKVAKRISEFVRMSQEVLDGSKKANQ